MKIGNQNATKLKTPELKEEAYRQYCDYIAKGLSKEGWYFDHPEFSLTWETMEKYIKEDPIVFEPIKKKIAECRSFRVWEGTGIAMMKGEAKSETALFQLFMRNKFGWDKEDRRESGNSEEFDQTLEIIKPR
jgi:hypothetical protein